jgi:hypothetical protein
VNDAWVELTAAEQNEIWPRFHQVFGRPAGGQALLEPTPALVYHLHLDSFWGMKRRPDGSPVWCADEMLERDCYGKMLRAFQQCLAPDEFLYVLDWQHDCYRFWPHRLPTDASAAMWKVPLLPDGDYYHFLAPDFRLGVLGYLYGLSGNEQDEPALCIFDDTLIRAVAADPPIVADRVVRRVPASQER